MDAHLNALWAEKVASGSDDRWELHRWELQRRAEEESSRESDASHLMLPDSSSAHPTCPSNDSDFCSYWLPSLSDDEGSIPYERSDVGSSGATSLSTKGSHDFNAMDVKYQTYPPAVSQAVGFDSLPAPLSDRQLRLVSQYRQTNDGNIPAERICHLASIGVLEHLLKSDGTWASVGSLRHEAGTCSPCAYWFKGLCKFGIECRYCHMVHEGQKSKRLRPSKCQRLRRSRAMNSEARHDQDQDQDQGQGQGATDRWPDRDVVVVEHGYYKGCTILKL